MAPSYVTGPPLLPPLSTLATRVLGAPLDEVVEASNDPRFLTAVIPSANLVTSANELGRFFEIFRAGGEMDGVRVMQERTIRRALVEQSHLEIDFSLFFPTRFSYGLMLGADWVSLYGRDTDLAFGHLGLINIMGWADPERAISVGLITTGKAIVYPELPRFYGVMSRIVERGAEDRGARLAERLGGLSAPRPARADRRSWTCPTMSSRVKADVRYVPSSENRSAASSLGRQISGYCNGVHVCYRFIPDHNRDSPTFRC